MRSWSSMPGIWRRIWCELVVPCAWSVGSVTPRALMRVLMILSASSVARLPSAVLAASVSSEEMVLPLTEADHADGTKSLTRRGSRSEEHTYELLSRQHIVCRLLLAKQI